jgi:hypothetical protein
LLGIALLRASAIQGRAEAAGSGSAACRQVFPLLRTYRAEGAAGLISKRRGRPSNRGKA